jgi:hypothetical protein
MIVVALGTLYGMGVGITMIGGIIYVMVLGSLHVKIPLWKTVTAAAFWPVTWAYVGYQLWKVYQYGA